MQNRSVKPLVLEIKPSGILFIIQLGLYVLSLVVIFTLINLHLLWAIILCIAATSYVAYLQCKTVGGYFTGNDYVLTLYENNDGVLEHTREISTYHDKYQLLGSSWVSNFLIILHFTTHHNRKIYLTLFKDSLNYDEYRTLRVYLNQARFAESEMSAE